jgi:streptogramin lyase
VRSASLVLCCGAALACGRPERAPVGPPARTGSARPPATAAVAGELLVASFMGDRVLRYDARTGAPLGAFAATPELDGALGMDRGPDGAIYVASEEANRVLRFDPRSGAYLGRFIWDDADTPVDETGGLQGPGAVLFGPDGALYVSSFDGDAILRYDARTGAFLDEFVAERSGGLDGPDAGMTFGPGGDLFVPGFYSDAVHRYDGVTGEFVERFTPEGTMRGPRTLIFRGEHLVVSAERSDAVIRFDAATGRYVDTPWPAIPGPAGLVFLADGALVVVSVDAQALVRYPDGGAEELLVAPGAAGLQTPTHALWLPG